MNLLLLAPDEVAAGRAAVTGRRARHMIDVLGVEPGAVVRAGVAGGRTGTATVTAIAGERVEVTITLGGPAAREPAVDLILALPRPKVLKRTLQTAAALGVGRIDLVNAWRVEKSYFQSPAMDRDALRDQLWLGCEQGGTTWLPKLRVHPLLMPFVERYLDEPDDRVRLLLHPRAETPIEAVVSPGIDRRVASAIGPEGGWIDRELATFERLEFRAVSLGDPVHRVEVAVPALLAQLALLARLRETAVE